MTFFDTLLGIFSQLMEVFQVISIITELLRLIGVPI